ncbi:MAG: hypothetical protein J7598_01750 [Mitsuaria chitosanitabida]|uniref:hypothetical protein n=1 Tax=Roseateles chitosanitabidus TaxID=65048 RepID=UPI001AFD213A|nr:hypothetical protein [Roseateles chitosanitabidus]MBO9685311.1 hypothetical protein [Roseateles chitosanitabidus]
MPSESLSRHGPTRSTAIPPSPSATPVGARSPLARSGPRAAVAAMLAGLALAAPWTAQAQGAQPSMEERLRTQLRATTAQLQQAQNELAALKSAAPAPAAPAAPAARPAALEALRRELAESRAALAREREARGQRDERDQQLAAARDAAQGASERSTAQVAQFRAAYDQLLKLARESEAERQRLAAGAAAQDAAIKQCQVKNQQLYEVGLDVLKAYETLGPGTILATRLPFAARSRVRLDEVAQQFGDKLYEGRFDPRAAQDPAPAAPAATPTGAAATPAPAEGGR